MKSIKKIIFTTTALSLLTISSAANAAGFYIQEQSVKGLGSAFSGSTTSIEDASTIYFNPAGMTKLGRAQVSAGLHLLIPSADLSNNGSTFFGGAATGGDGGNPYSPTPIPNLYAVTPINDQLWAGIGVSAPFGLGSDYGETWFGRYDSTETELKTINIQPSAAYKINNRLSIGAGIDIQYADAELNAVVSNVASEGISTLKGDDWSIGYNIGLQAQVLPTTEIGVHYRSAISHELEGRIKLEGLNAGNFDIKGTADLDLPDLLTAGIAHDVTDDLRLSGQLTWFGWNNFQEIRGKNEAGATVSNVEQNYQNTLALAVGAEYDLNDQWTVRGGYQYDETPTNDTFRTSRTPDGDRNWFSGGATYKLNDKIDLDFAATYIDISEEKINVTRNSGLANVKAKTEGNVGILAVGLNYKF